MFAFSVVSLFLAGCHGFLHNSKFSMMRTCNRQMSQSLSMKYSDVQEISYSTIALSGFISKSSNIADSFPFLKLHEKNKYDVITAVSDDVGFAKKRLASPETVYSGLFDVLEYAVAADVSQIESVLQGKEAWLGFNITTADLPTYASIAAKSGLKRVIFGVRLTEEEQGPNINFEDSCEILNKAGLNYTIIKFGEIRPMGEARYPYRVRRGNESLPLPTFEFGQGQLLSNKDLYRVITECVDLAKTFNKVYSIGPGTYLDSEVLVYMKAQGWPERVQVGMMMGDLMDSIERKYKDETERVAKLNPQKPAALSAAAISAGERTRSTGFFN